MIPQSSTAEELHLPEGYSISDHPDRFDLKQAHDWISVESYWAPGIPFETFRRACESSLTVGVFAPGGGMVAMARAVTDGATFAWICDVFVDPACRGLGIGKALIGCLLHHPRLQGLRRVQLATRDAHGLYAGFGFRPISRPDTWMEIRNDHAYERPQ